MGYHGDLNRFFNFKYSKLHVLNKKATQYVAFFPKTRIKAICRTNNMFFLPATFSNMSELDPANASTRVLGRSVGPPTSPSSRNHTPLSFAGGVWEVSDVDGDDDDVNAKL